MTEVAAVIPDVDSEMRPPAALFAVGGAASRAPVLPNLPQALRRNKTGSLVMPKGCCSHGE